MNDTGTPANFTELAVAVGRIEEKVGRVSGIEDRLREVEKSVERIEVGQKPKAPWYLVVGGVAGILTGAVTIVTLISILAKLGTF